VPARTQAGNAPQSGRRRIVEQRLQNIGLNPYCVERTVDSNVDNIYIDTRLE
jgi:hypothetical protein